MNIFLKKSVRKANVYNIFTIFVPSSCSAAVTQLILVFKTTTYALRHAIGSARLDCAMHYRQLPSDSTLIARAFRPHYPFPEQA